MRKSRKDKLKFYQGEVERSVRWRRNEGYDRLWSQLIELYKNEVYSDDDDLDQIAVNYAFSTINVILPSITVNDPQIRAAANNPQYEDRANLVGGLLNYQWRHHRYKESFQLAAKDYLMLGLGWAKIGWRYVEESREMDDDEVMLAFDEQMQMADEIAQAQPHLAPQLPSGEQILQNLVSTNTVVVEDRPFVERVSPFDVFVNVEATAMSNARWIAQKILRPIEDVQADSTYIKSARKRVQGGKWQRYTAEDPRSNQDTEDAQLDMVLIWEFYDLVEGVYCVFADEGDFLVAPQDMPYSYGHPYEALMNYTVPDQFYPIGDLEMIAPLVMEINKTRTEMMNWRKKFSRKWLIRQDAFMPDEISKLESDEDGLVIRVNQAAPLNESIIPMPTSPLDSQLFSYGGQIIQDIQEVSGVSEYARGSGGAIRRTATEAAMIQDSLNARSAQKLAAVEDFVARVARKILQINQQFIQGKQVARILGPEGETVWAEYKREDILGEFDFAVEAGSTQPNNEMERRQKALTMAQVLGPYIGTVIDPAAFVQHLLVDGFGIKNWEKLTLQQGAPPPPDPMAAPAEGPQGQGPDAPQLNPMQRREADSAAVAAPSTGTIPDPLLNQLANQQGLMLQAS